MHTSKTAWVPRLLLLIPGLHFAMNRVGVSWAQEVLRIYYPSKGPVLWSPVQTPANGPNHNFEIDHGGQIRSDHQDNMVVTVMYMQQIWTGGTATRKRYH